MISLRSSGAGKAFGCGLAAWAACSGWVCAVADEATAIMDVPMSRSAVQRMSIPL
jgi:hypothetical protein